MEPSYALSPAFPPLAWLAWHSRGEAGVHVIHGCDVETRPHFFIEGAWAGPYAEGEPHHAESVFGSGAVFDKTGAWFVSSSATTDYLYYREGPDGFSVSNSLPALLAHLDDGLRPDFAGYTEINRSIQDGIHRYQAIIPTVRGGVRRVLWWNIRVSAAGVDLVEKPAPPGFGSFSGYRDYLATTIRRLLENARHPDRRQPMSVFSTQSRGYDSTAVNALAAACGIDRVLTSPESKEKSAFYRRDGTPNPSDDGTDICRRLGLECSPISRRAFESDIPDEHYYWACHDNNQDFNMHEVHRHIERPTLLLTGHLGETWYTLRCAGKRYAKMSNDALFCWSQAGHGLAEVRLVNRLVQVAVPFIGARSRKDIFRITESAEMDPWRLNNSYDRPIARRIAEEAGVAREMFGQVKLASIVHLPTPNVPITPALRHAFFRHLLGNRLAGRVGVCLLPLVQRLNGWIYWKNPERHFKDRNRHPLLWHLGYAWSKLTGRPLRIRMLWTRIDAYLYAYCVNRVRDEYAAKLGVTRFDGNHENR